jgi:two-component system cell cycle response regulator DivK
VQTSKEIKDPEEQFTVGTSEVRRLIPNFPVDAKKRLKVLVVEDNKTNMKLVVNLLEIGGYNPIQAFSAGEGIRSSEIYKPALIVMDISLPDMDGLAATRVIKSNPLTSHIPVIALTAGTMKIDEETAKESGCDAYFVKPFDIWIFYRTLVGLIKTVDKGQV